MRQIRRTLRGTMVAGAVCIALAACEHPIALTSSHAEVADVVVRDSGSAQITRTVDNRAWSTDSIVIDDGPGRRLVVNLLDFQGREFSFAERRDLEIRIEAENDALVRWEPRSGYALLQGFVAGRTRVRFLVWHVSHPDLITPWITVVVRAR